MNRDVLSGRQLICIVGLYIIGSASLSGGSGISGQDTWIAMLLAVAAAVPLVLLYARISTLYGQRNLFEIIYKVFGRGLGWLVTLLVTLYCFQLGALVLRNFPEFVQAASLPKTPKIILAMLIGLVCGYMAKLGVSTFGKTGAVFSGIVVVVVTFTFLLLIPNMQPDNLKPVLTTPPDVLGLNAARLLTLPLGETVLLLCLFCNLKDGQSKYKVYLLGLAFGGGYLVVSILRNIMALGAGNFTSLFFPSYNAVGTINVGDFFQRVEVMVAGYLLLCDIVKIAVAVYATSLGVAKLMNVGDYRKVTLPITWLMIASSTVVFGGTAKFFSWTPAYFYFSLPFQVGLPLILWLYAERRAAIGKM